MENWMNFTGFLKFLIDILCYVNLISNACMSR